MLQKRKANGEGPGNSMHRSVSLSAAQYCSQFYDSVAYLLVWEETLKLIRTVPSPNEQPEQRARRGSTKPECRDELRSTDTAGGLGFCYRYGKWAHAKPRCLVCSVGVPAEQKVLLALLSV